MVSVELLRFKQKPASCCLGSVVIEDQSWMNELNSQQKRMLLAVGDVASVLSSGT